MRKSYIEDCFKTFVNKAFTMTIFHKNVFNFTNFRAYDKTAKTYCRNWIELILRGYLTIKMRENTTKSWFTVNLGG